MFLALLLNCAPARGQNTAANVSPNAKKANSLLMDAIKAQSGGDQNSAVVALKQALDLVPDFFDAESLLGRILLQEKQYPEAQIHLRNALNINPDHVDTLIALGRLLTEKLEFAEAESFFQRAIEKSGQSARSVFEMARCYDAQAKYYDAVKQYQKVLEINPSFAQAHYSIGRSFQNGGFYELALDEYKKEIELGSHLPELYYKMGFCAAQIGSTDEAAEYFRQSIEHDQKVADSLYSLGIVYAQALRYDEAIEAFNKCIDMNTSIKASAYYNIAFICEAQKNTDKAIEYYKLSIKANPADADARYGLAAIYAEQKNYEKALGEYEKIIKIKGNPSPEKAYTMIGTMYNNIGRTLEALENIQNALNIKANYAPALVQKAIANIKQNQIEEARKVLEKSLEIDEADYLAHFNLAYCYEFGRDGKRYGADFALEKALLHYKICLELQPTYAAAFENITILSDMQAKEQKAATAKNLDAEMLYAAGKRFFKNKDFTNARVNFEKALEINPGNPDLIRYIAACQKEEEKISASTKETGDVRHKINSLLARGQNFFLQEKYDTAIEQWDKVLKLDPKHSLAKQNIKKASAVMNSQIRDIKEAYQRGEALYSKRQYRESLDEFNKIMVINPQYSTGTEYVNKAQQMILTVIRILNSKKDIVPKVIAKANNLVIDGRYDQAVRELKKALVQNPKHTTLIDKIQSIEKTMNEELANIRHSLDLADEMTQKGNFNDAIFEYNKIIALNPRYEQGEKLLEKARGKVDELMNRVQSEKQAVTAFLLEGEELFSQGNYIDAMAKWKSVLSLDKDNPIARRNIERAEQALSQEKRSREQTDKYLLEARLANKEQNNQQAMSLLNKVLAVDPENRQAMDLLKKVSNELNESKRIEQTKLQKIKDYFESAHKLIRDNRFDDAIKELQHILALDPGNEESKNMIKSIMQTKSRETESIKLKQRIETLIRDHASLIQNRYMDENGSI